MRSVVSPPPSSAQNSVFSSPRKMSQIVDTELQKCSTFCPDRFSVWQMPGWKS